MRLVLPLSPVTGLVCCWGILLLIGCGEDAAGPPATGPLTVAVGVAALSPPVLDETPEGIATIACLVDLRARAEGPGIATWEDAVFRFYAGRVLTTPFDSVVIPASDVRDSWGQQNITSAEPLSARWQFTATIPFSTALAYRYQADGVTKATEVELTCSPAIPAGAQAPSVSPVTISPFGGDIQVGDTLFVTYTATAPVGLWQTLIVLSGACDTIRFFPERLVTSVTRTAAVPVPSGCVHEASLYVTVVAVDAAIETASRPSFTQFTFVDNQPPELSFIFFTPDRVLEGVAAGDFFVGESLSFRLIGTDNNRLDALIWEVAPGGRRDSLQVTGTHAVRDVTIPVPAEWVGSIELRLYARDGAGNSSIPRVSQPDSLRVYPTIARPTSYLGLHGEVRDAVFDTRRQVLYLLQANQQRVAVVAVGALGLVGTFPLPGYATGLDLVPGGDSLILVHPTLRALSIFDLTQSPPTGVTVPLEGLDSSNAQRPYSVLTAANRKALISLEGNTESAYRVLELDLTTGAERLRLEAGAGNSTGVVARSHDHSLVLVGSDLATMQTYSAASDSFGSLTTVGIPNQFVSIDSAGQNIAIHTRIYNRSLQLVQQIRSNFAQSVPISVISADGQFLIYGFRASSLARSRVSDGDLSDRSLLSLHAQFLRMSPDGDYLLAVESLDGIASIIGLIDMR